MIATLRGPVLHKETDSLVVGTGGVGLQVYVPAALRDRISLGDQLSLHTVLIVRQDLLALYGFETRQEKEYFNLLLGVDGIGPRLALAAISALNPDAIRRAVFHEQPEVFSRVPGVGKKTAQKILLHLQGKIGAADDLAPVAELTDLDNEVFEALTSLGYSVVEAQAALQSLPQGAPQNVEERLVLALKYFS